MKIIICVAAVVVAFFVGWNAAQLRWLDKISDILDTLNWATKTYGELSSDERSFVRGMMKTIALLQGYEEGCLYRQRHLPSCCRQQRCRRAE